MLAADADDQSWKARESLLELTRLAETAGVEVVGTVSQRLRVPDPRSFLGKGKIQELKDEKSVLRFDAAITDDELSPAQQRYLEEALNVQVLDRTALILHIFALHARTREGRLQVELAQYRYRLPRLTGRGVELSRLGAGINTRGPGETKLESDRRRIRHRISELNREIEQVRQQRAILRSHRRQSGVPVVALAGYTNAGKSTLLNRLTGANVLSSDQLFATLDPTTRRVELENGQHILLTDTVGFIQKLPTDLVAAFRATLEEITEADLILHIVDASHPQADEQAEAVEDELEDLGVGMKPRITALNKIDLVQESQRTGLEKRFENPILISASTGFGMEELGTCIASQLASHFVEVRVHIPYTESSLLGLFRARGMVESEEHEMSGTTITGLLPGALLPRFDAFISQESSRRSL
ncbi:MAG: GTPase HflX [Chloroflexota bacterium]